MIYPVKPEDINAQKHFWSSFDNNETEVSARILVLLAQKNGDWRNFTKAEADEISGQDFSFNRLLGDPNYAAIVENADGTYSFTHKFVATCFLSSPATNYLNEAH